MWGLRFTVSNEDVSQRQLEQATRMMINGGFVKRFFLGLFFIVIFTPHSADANESAGVENTGSPLYRRTYPVSSCLRYPFFFASAVVGKRAQVIVKSNKKLNPRYTCGPIIINNFSITLFSCYSTRCCWVPLFRLPYWSWIAARE